MRSSAKDVMEKHGYFCSLRWSKYYDILGNIDRSDSEVCMGIVQMTYPRTFKLYCNHNSEQGRCPFCTVVRGYFHKKTPGMVIFESYHSDSSVRMADDRFKDKVHSAVVQIKYGMHNKKRDEQVGRLHIPTHLAEEAYKVPGRITFVDVVRYQEKKHDMFINEDALLSRLRLQLCTQCPRARGAMLLIEKLHSMSTNDSIVTFDYVL